MVGFLAKIHFFTDFLIFKRWIRKNAWKISSYNRSKQICDCDQGCSLREKPEKDVWFFSRSCPSVSWRILGSSWAGFCWYNSSFDSKISQLTLLIPWKKIFRILFRIYFSVHDVEFAPNIDIIINETLPALEKVKKAGKAKFIGVTGYPLHTLNEIIEKSTVKIDLVLAYTRLNFLIFWLISLLIINKYIILL